VACELFLARLKLGRGDVAEAAALLSKADQDVRRNNFTQRVPEVAAAHVLILVRQGDLAAAGQLALTHGLPMSQARVHLAQADSSAALAVLEPARRQAEEKGWQDQRLKVMVLQAIARHANGDMDEALRILGEALALAEPNCFVRTFVDEGAPMAGLLAEATAQGIMSDYAAKLLAAFETEDRKSENESDPDRSQALVEPLSRRELEVLRLVAQGLSNHEISERLFLALSTVKGHNLKIFEKLQVKRRTEAIVRARELGLLKPKH
jgi:LuxR family maltose regulon positive regulatory protein